MKRHFGNGLVLAALGGLSVTPVRAQIVADPGTPLDPNIATLTLTIDERGPGEKLHVVYKNGAVADTVLHATAVSAGPDFPAGTLVLAYVLPVPGGVQDGDVFLNDTPANPPIEDDAVPPDPQDIVRFHKNTICFYSDNKGETEPQAQRSDIGIPTTLQNLKVTVEESNGLGATYTANGGGPDDTHYEIVPTLGTGTYMVISDVPEPGAFAMLTGSALFGAGLLLRRRRK